MKKPYDRLVPYKVPSEAFRLQNAGIPLFRGQRHRRTDQYPQPTGPYKKAFRAATAGSPLQQPGAYPPGHTPQEPQYRAKPHVCNPLRLEGY